MTFVDRLQRNYGSYYYPMQGSTANRLYSYKVEYQVGTGATWQTLTTVTGSGLLNSIITKTVPITINTANANCQVRVTDNYRNTIVAMSGVFAVTPVTSGYINGTFVWDYSYPQNNRPLQGGCMMRTAVNNYPNYYNSTANYGKGFINKAITINTPHNSSPWADLLTVAALNNDVSNFLSGASIYYDAYNWLSGTQASTYPMFSSMFQKTNGIWSTTVATENEQPTAANSLAMKLYPSPTQGQFTLAVENTMLENATITVFNLVGQTISEQRISGQSATLDLTLQPQGMYFVRLRTEKQGEVTQKIQKF